MKFATYKDGSRDGQLVVVSRDLSQAHYASHIANRLQQALDDWNFLSPQLQDVFDALNAGRARHAFPFDPAQCMAPLPRAYQCVRAAADLQMEQRTGDSLLGAHEPMRCAIEALGLDFAAGVAVVTGDIPQGCAPERALDGVRLLMLCNSLSLRHLLPAQGAQGAGATSAATATGAVAASVVQSQCAMAFSPVAITPDELGEAWSRGQVNLQLQCSWNGRKVGMADASADRAQPFGQLIALLAMNRPLRAGSIVVAPPRSNAASEYLRHGDTLRIEMKNAAGHSLFGTIAQEMTP